MALRSSLDLELRPLLKALRNRIDGLRGTVVMEPKDRLEVFSRDGVPFMQLEIRRDHMNVDLWLSEERLVEARSTDLARPHPFDPENAVVVRFERATDLTTVARWLEDAHAHALVRKEDCAEATVESKPADAITTKVKVAPKVQPAKSPSTKAPAAKAAPADKTAPASATKRPAAKRSAAARRA